MDKTYQDGWQVIPVSQVFDGIRLSVTAGKEQDRLVDIMTDLLSGFLDLNEQTYMKWFFSEEHSDDKNVDAEKIREELQNLKTDVVYDSNWLRNPVSDSGCNSITVGTLEDDGSGHGEIYVVFNQFHRCLDSCKQSEDGCLSGASALSEYFMFEV